MFFCIFGMVRAPGSIADPNSDFSPLPRSMLRPPIKNCASGLLLSRFLGACRRSGWTNIEFTNLAFCIRSLVMRSIADQEAQDGKARSRVGSDDDNQSRARSWAGVRWR